MARLEFPEMSMIAAPKVASAVKTDWVPGMGRAVKGTLMPSGVLRIGLLDTFPSTIGYTAMRPEIAARGFPAIVAIRAVGCSLGKKLMEVTKASDSGTRPESGIAVGGIVWLWKGRGIGRPSGISPVVEEIR